MNVAAQFVRRSLTLVVAAVACSAGAPAMAQSPYLLPYTIQVLAGGGTSVTVPNAAPGPLSTPCTGSGQTGSQFDSFGDGCSVTSSSVVVGSGADIHDVAVDGQGNVYFLDDTSSNAVIRRIDARSGKITVYAGSFASPQPPCSTSIDKYGDTCLANDGKANAGTLVTANGTTTVVPDGYTGGFAKARGLAVNRNGDVYLAQYSGNVVNRISASTGIMTLVAGLLGGGTVTKPTGNIGQKGYTGDGGPATSAEINSDRGVGVDAAGNIYIADTTNNVVRKVTAATGIISTIVGVYPGSNAPGVAGSGGDGGPAASAQVSAPEDVVVDANGNLFIADFGNNKVRVVYAGGAVVAGLISKTNNGANAVVGNIYTIMGGGTGVYTAGTQVLATSVPVGGTRKLAIDARGNVYLADNGFDVIWFLDATTGYMRVIAGTYAMTSGGAGCPGKIDNFGDNCPATLATVSPNSAMGVAVDGLGNLYITDPGDARLRKVLTDQTFPALAAGSSAVQVLQVHFAAGDSPAAANPYSLTGSKDFTLASSSCTVNADTTQDCLLNVSFTPTGPGLEAATLVVNSNQNGTAAFGVIGTGIAAALAIDPGATSLYASALKSPAGIAQDGAGNVYIADTGNNRILQFSAAGAPTVLAGSGLPGYAGDNAAAAAATLNAPRGVVVTRNGTVYIADTGNNVIRQVDPVTHVISTVGGGAAAVCAGATDALGDGCLGTAATFNKPAGLAADSDGNVYVSDSGNNLIRELAITGYVFKVGGGASAVCAAGDVFGNGCPANQVVFANPTAIQLDSSRNLYIADTGNNEVREFQAASSTVIDIAGTGQAGASGNGGAAISAQLSGPTGLAVDAAGDVYIADTGNGVIRLVNSSGTINTVAGTLGAPGTGTLPGSAAAVQLNNPSAVVSNGAGALVILDSGNNRAIADNRTAVSFNFGRTNTGSSSPTVQFNQTATGSASAILSPTLTALFTPAPTPPFALAGTGSTGCTGGQTLSPGNSCLLFASFSPSATQLGPFNATYTENSSNAPAPSISLIGVGAVLTPTTATAVVTSPATGNPQYSVPFTVTTTVTPASCNIAAPSCFPTGTVTFFVDGTQVGLAVPLGTAATASQSIPGLGVGKHTVTAVYSGDTFYASSSAGTLTVTVAQGTTTTVITLSPASGPQFSAFTLSAKVSSATANIPTGTVTFFAGTTMLGTASINAQTGVATLLDTLNPVTSLSAPYYSNFGLNAGTYAITAVYSGGANSNYGPSTSAPATLTIAADTPAYTVTLSTTAVGTAQGSTIALLATIIPTNTFSGPVTLSCTSMPANSTCTFQPTTIAFSPVAGVPSGQQDTITLWTDVPNGVIPGQTRNLAPAIFRSTTGGSSFAALLGTPALFLSFVGMIGFRRKFRRSRLLLVLTLFASLAGGSALMSGCSSANINPAITPVGVYTVNFVVSGGSGASVSTPITFTVGQGAPGQL